MPHIQPQKSVSPSNRPMRRWWHDRTDALCTFSLGAIAIIMSAAWWPHTIDDTYITVRCAENLATGMGSGFNPFVHEEVSSSPLSVWLLALAVKLGLDAVVCAKCLGILAAGILAPLSYRGLRSVNISYTLALCPALLIATYTGLHIHAASGLETLTYALCVTGSATGLMATPTSRSARGTWAIALAGVSLLRPEGVAVAAVLVAVVILDTSRKSLRGFAVAAGALTIIGMAIRFSEFGTLLPNPYFAKPSPLRSVIDSAAIDWPRFGELVRTKAARIPWLWGWPMLGLAVWAGVRLRFSDIGRAPIIVSAVGIAFVAFAPADWMPEHRFFLPYLPATLILITLALHNQSQQYDAGIQRPLMLALALLSALVVATNLRSTANWKQHYAQGDIIAALDGARYHRPIGKWLQHHARSGDRILAYEIGAVGYFSGLHVIDHEGLASRANASIIQEGGGYYRVRNGGSPHAAQELIQACLAENPCWFLVRTRYLHPLHLRQPVPVGMARTKLQNQFLEVIGPEMVLVREFIMTKPNDRYLLLRRRNM